ncbi:MAG TPA: KpsF/GutQ family sugar-phosphate isomerase [Tepidisphaeraceae bacterium]|jgi:arabinose-5-phosphate isomerase|nr:KpsF/GutQ family sugar-phosphate isomerase [Tepidisphaeraceae bacterium]
MSQAILQFARQALETEAAAVRGIVLDDQFMRAVRLILDCNGSVLTSGIGKAGHVARKLAASFSSTGSPSHFLSPADALHGDLGSIRKGDIVVILSHSGESDEILRMLSVVKKIGNVVIAVTATADNALARFSDVVLKLGKIEEACPLGLAPSASTTAMTALGDALFLSVMKMRSFSADEFALYHPGGQLGRKMIRVREAMTFKVGENLPVANDRLTVGQVLHEVSRIKRRSGAVVLVDDAGKMTGIFSDGDLRRVITDNDGSALRQPIREVMTRNPKRIGGDQLASEAIAVMRQYRIDDLPVVDVLDRPIGIIDIQDLVVLRMLDVEP